MYYLYVVELGTVRSGPVRSFSKKKRPDRSDYFQKKTGPDRTDEKTGPDRDRTGPDRRTDDIKNSLSFHV